MNACLVSLIAISVVGVREYIILFMCKYLFTVIISYTLLWLCMPIKLFSLFVLIYLNYQLVYVVINLILLLKNAYLFEYTLLCPQFC